MPFFYLRESGLQSIRLVGCLDSVVIHGHPVSVRSFDWVHVHARRLFSLL